MQIIWQKEDRQSPYYFRQRAEWDGLIVHRARVVPGRMLEHSAEHHEINISIAGSKNTERISATGKRRILRDVSGGMCLTPAGQTVAAFWEKPLDNLGIFLKPDFVMKTAVENRFSSNFSLYDNQVVPDPLVQHIGLALLDESQTASPAGRLYADSLINTLTIHLLKNYSDARYAVAENLNGGLSGYRLRRVEEFINANLEADLSLAEIAEIADLSQFHFARAFRKSTGLTPQQYLMRQRIERAKELLAKEDLPLVEISLRTGFKNQSHFTTLFRKFTKFTPKTWRELKLA